jgi:hypothetical protein
MASNSMCEIISYTTVFFPSIDSRDFVAPLERGYWTRENEIGEGGY